MAVRRAVAALPADVAVARKLFLMGPLHVFVDKGLERRAHMGARVGQASGPDDAAPLRKGPRKIDNWQEAHDQDDAQFYQRKPATAEPHQKWAVTVVVLGFFRGAHGV
jgi:hypothetical protein